jgi:aspartate aminotransferase
MLNAMRTSPGAFGIDVVQKKYNLSLGEPHLSRFPLSIMADLVSIKDIHRYYPSSGSESLRQALLNKYYPGLNIENISITHGAIGALDVILRSNSHLTDLETEILLPDPGFPPYEKLAEFSKLKIKKYKINLAKKAETLIDWQGLAEQVSAQTKIILINSPNNPTGKLFTDHDRLQLGQILDKNPQLHFIMDEVYRELIFTGDKHTELISFLDRGYIVGSFSKMYPLQGARIGWVATNPQSMKKLMPFLNNAYGAISSFGQELAQLMLDKNFNFSAPYFEALATVEEVLTEFQIPHVVPLGGFFCFLDFKVDDRLVAEKLLSLGVMVVPGSTFGSQGRNHIRICFAQKKSDLEESLRIISSLWHQLQSENL